jgi:hypothetical protein
MHKPLVITHNGGEHMNYYLSGTPTMAKAAKKSIILPASKQNNYEFNTYFFDPVISSICYNFFPMQQMQNG